MWRVVAWSGVQWGAVLWSAVQWGLSTHKWRASRVSPGCVVAQLIVCFAFLTSIIWILIIANELGACLVAISHMLCR